MTKRHFSDDEIRSHLAHLDPNDRSRRIRAWLDRNLDNMEKRFAIEPTETSVALLASATARLVAASGPEDAGQWLLNLGALLKGEIAMEKTTVQ